MCTGVDVSLGNARNPSGIYYEKYQCLKINSITDGFVSAKESIKEHSKQASNNDVSD